jgi:hypothetical protein
MVIYMMNLAGGTKVATMELEAQYDEQHGWFRYNPHTPVVAAPVEEVKVGRQMSAEAKQAISIKAKERWASRKEQA